MLALSVNADSPIARLADHAIATDFREGNAAFVSVVCSGLLAVARSRYIAGLGFGLALCVVGDCCCGCFAVGEWVCLFFLPPSFPSYIIYFFGGRECLLGCVVFPLFFVIVWVFSHFVSINF